MAAIKKHTQYSKDNPGWAGKGVPSTKLLLRRLLRNPLILIRQREYRPAYYKFIANFSDFKNFTFPQPDKAIKCPCCGWQGPAFLATSNEFGVTHQSKCPICDSRSRHRGLAVLLPQIMSKPKETVLVFAPEKVVLNILGRLDQNYLTTDLFSLDVDFPNEDIQSLTFQDASFDWIICNHVLEHVPDDQKAMAECFRVIKPGGKAVFTVPGDYSQQDTKILPPPVSNGHFRLYGMDICKKFTSVGFHVEPIDMGLFFDRGFGIRIGDFAFVCSKI